MGTQEQIHDYLVEQNICSAWEAKLRGSNNIEDYISASLSGQGIEFIARNEFIIPDWFQKSISKYLGKEYISKEGRTATLMAGIRGYRELPLETELLHLMDSVAVVKVPDGYIGEVVLTRGSNVILEIGSDIILFVSAYNGSKVTLINLPDSRSSKIDVYCDTRSKCENKVNMNNYINLRYESV